MVLVLRVKILIVLVLVLVLRAQVLTFGIGIGIAIPVYSNKMFLRCSPTLQTDDVRVSQALAPIMGSQAKMLSNSC